MESDVPADPVAKGLAHHHFEVGAPQPGQFLREQRHALAPRTMHAGDIGAPEHAPRSERIEHPMQRVVYTVEWVRIQGIAGLAGRFHRHVLVSRQGQQFRQVAIGGLRPLCRAGHPHVVDADLQCRMAFGDFADPRQERRRLE